MRAMILEAPGESLKLAELPVPQPDPGQLLVSGAAVLVPEPDATCALRA